MDVRIAVWFVLLTLASAVQSAGYEGQTFRVTGTWSGSRIEATRLQLREQEEDTAKGQVSGRIEELDLPGARLRIGPVNVLWQNTTVFRDLAAENMTEGMSIRVSGRMQGPALVASSIQPASSLPVGTLQITGVVVPSAGGDLEDITILGQRVAVNQPGYNRLDSLTQRQDARRPDRPFGFELFGRRATVTGEYDLSFRDRKHLRLDNRSRVRDLDHELKLELFYPLSDRTWLFLSGKGVYEGEIYRAGGNNSSTRYLARDQTWLYFDRMGLPGLSAQIGRINLAEPREWWWDDDLDAIRLMHDAGPWHSEFVLARELLRERSDDPGIDPEDERVARLASRLSWLWAPKQTLEALLLHARDRSSTPGVGLSLPVWQEDESDARLTWLGLRALGDRSLGKLGDLRYWADAAWLRGRETLVDYDEDAGLLTVEDVDSRKVRGSAFDVGLSWETRLPGRPSFTLGYAWSSGDDDSGDGVDHAFRQTGLHNNKWRFHGVNRFRIYGELLRPELANLSVSTAGLGLSLGTARSLDLVYHRYRQDRAARSLRDARVSASLDGRSTDVGEEWDLVLGSREWARVDLALSGAMFRAGRAYGSKAGERAYQVLFEITINF